MNIIKVLSNFTIFFFNLGMAWLIMSLNLNIPIVGDMRFTSWRLFIILLIVPILLSTLLLWKLPESPKFLLSQGKPDETLDILKSVFALNKNKRKESFPVGNSRRDKLYLFCHSFTIYRVTQHSIDSSQYTFIKNYIFQKYILT